MRRMHLAATAAFIAALISAPAAVSAPPDVDSTRLEQLVTVQGITDHQKALQNIADLNGGTRYTRTPGYTASAAYVKATLEKAGYDARYEMFNMPVWHETAPPVLQQVSPTTKTYNGGQRSGRQLAVGRLHRFRALADEVAHERHGRADQRHRHPEPGGTTSGLRDVGLPRRDERRRGADPARHVRVHAEAAERRDGGRGRRDPLQRGRHAPLGATRCSARPIRATRSRRCCRASPSARSSTTPTGGQNPTVNLATNGVDVETLYPNVVAETPRGDANHMVLPVRIWIPSRRVQASTTTARARRSSSSWPSSSPRRALRRATRSASYGSAARRTAWSARSTTPPTCPTPRSRART